MTYTDKTDFETDLIYVKRACELLNEQPSSRDILFAATKIYLAEKFSGGADG